MTKVEEIIHTKNRPLIGAVAHTFNPVFAEIAGLLGFDVLWIEMEHLPISYAEAANLCRIASGLGMLTMIRIPDTRRESVLKAAECGPDIIDLPMGNSTETLGELVQNARYAPEGSRGFFSSSRATKYGLHDIGEEQKRINRELCLLSQIETLDAVNQAEDLCSVQGIDGIFIGPGDLSTSMGLPGRIGDTSVQEAISRTVRVAKDHGKLVAIPCAASEVGRRARDGVDILFCGGEISFLKDGLRNCLNEARDSLG